MCSAFKIHGPPTCADPGSAWLSSCGYIRWTSVGNPRAWVSSWMYSSTAGPVHLLLHYTDSAWPCAPQSQRGEMARIQLNFYQWHWPLAETNVLRYCSIIWKRLIQEELAERRKRRAQTQFCIESHQLHWAACSVVTINTHTVVYFHSIPHTPSCCSMEHQMWINPPLKIVPKKFTNSLCSSNVH